MIEKKIHKGFSRVTLRGKKIRHAPPGAGPGTISIPDDALQVKAKVISYNENSCSEKNFKSVAEIKNHIDRFPNDKHWIDVKGFGDKVFFEQLADVFGIHRLQIEDVLNTYQRPKAEEYAGHLFLISRVLNERNDQLCNDQLSIFLGENFVISIHDQYEDQLNPVRERLSSGKGYMRKYGADYLAYSLMDTTLDNYFPLLEKIGDRLDELEEELISNPKRESMNKILKIKRDLIVLRRSVWPERDKVNDIIRSHFPLIAENTKIFFRDMYDHCIQVLDIVESYKEVTSSLMDVYLSSVSNKLNQVMKVLTIISTIFIPLTFIVGLYGMNFAHTNPKTGEPLPMNMPELYSPYGYFGVCIFMLALVIVQIIFFYRKGWITKSGGM